ncbi:Guanine nucleotide-binding protein G(o) subunit alpha, partial [Bulinus truncatus]
LSGAGKSTLAKQVRMIHEKGFADKEKALYREIVRQNIVTAVLGVLHEMEAHGVQFSTEELRQTANNIKDRLKSTDSPKAVVDMRHSLALLTSQKTLKDFMDTYLDVEMCQLNHYLFRSLEKILSDSYAPTDYDILRVRQKTTGLNEILFHFKGFEFRLCDVDGHCSVKKKWLQNFENVSAILFTVALSSYDVRSKDKDEHMELHDALHIFSTVSAYDGFRKSPIILFLNKKDIFQQKLKKVPLTVAFPDYKGTSDFSEASLFVQSKFESCVAESADRLTVHITNATDTPSIRSVFDASLVVVLDQA